MFLLTFELEAQTSLPLQKAKGFYFGIKKNLNRWGDKTSTFWKLKWKEWESETVGARPRKSWGGAMPPSFFLENPLCGTRIRTKNLPRVRIQRFLQRLDFMRTHDLDRLWFRSVLCNLVILINFLRKIFFLVLRVNG